MIESLRTPPLLSADQSLFLDLDGTIAQFEDTPVEVRPDPARTRLVVDLVRRLEGRVAILSGRSLDEVDRILPGACASVAGIHGLTRRTPDGQIVDFAPSPGLASARSALQALAHSRAGLLFENKSHSVAIHFRRAPDAADLVRDAAERVAASTDLVLQPGEMVFELRTPGPDKGASLKAFMAEPLFAGHQPVAVGDDLTDEHAFVAAQEMGGYGVLVGPGRTTAARYRVDSVEAVFAWLQADQDQLAL